LIRHLLVVIPFQKQSWRFLASLAAEFPALRHLGIVFSRCGSSETDVEKFFEDRELERVEFACRGEVGCDMSEEELEWLYGKGLPVGSGVGVDESMERLRAAIRLTG
jgi:hypothetical protein